MCGINEVIGNIILPNLRFLFLWTKAMIEFREQNIYNKKEMFPKEDVLWKINLFKFKNC